MGKRITKFLGIILVIAMLLPLIPASLVNSAEGNPFNYNVYGSAGGSGVMKNEVINQVTNLTDYYYHEGRDPDTGFKDPKYVTGSPAVKFVSFENNGGAWSSGVYVVELSTANLSPELTFKSGNGGNWNIKFENDGVYDEDAIDPEAELVISCNFSNKQGYLKIGNKSVSGKGRKELAVKFKDMSEQVIEIGGNKKTKVNGVYGYVRDNTPAYIKSVDVTQEGANLVVTATASEALRSFGSDAARDEWNRTYVKVTVQDARSGGNTDYLTAYIKSVSGDKIIFEAPLGDWVGKDYTVMYLSPSTLKTIDGTISFDHRELIYDYTWYRGSSSMYSYYGCKFFKSFSVATRSTFLSDEAGNSLSLGNIARTMKKTFDNTTPKVDGVSLTAPGKIMNITASSNKDDWPEDIKLSDLYISEGEKVYFKVTTDEALSRYEGIKLAVNVKDETGKQVVLPMYKISTLQTLYGVPQSVMEFGPMTIKEGYSMMNGYEGKRIAPTSLTYTVASDGAGHNLNAHLFSPAEQLYLDLTGPTVSVTKLDRAQNSPYATFKVDIADAESGLYGTPVVVTLKGKTDAASSFRYLVSDSMSAPTDASAYTEQVQLSGDSTVQIPFKAHAQHEYTGYIHLMLEPGLEQIVDGIVASATTEDVLGNSASSDGCTIDYDYDNIKPSVSTTGILAKYHNVGSSNASVSVNASFVGTDHRNIPVIQYLWLIDDASVPTAASEWKVAGGFAKLDSQLQLYKYSGSQTTSINDGADHTVYFWARMQDEYGNWSDPVGTSIDVYLSKPSLNVEVLSDINVPNYEHNVTVTAPDARESDGAVSYTRITMKVGDKTYFRVVKTGESTNVFDFDGTWYTGAILSGTYSGITEVTDFTSVKQHYGSITLSFESAYVPLTPVSGERVNVSNASYVNHSQKIDVVYSGVQPDGVEVHKVEFLDFRSSIGEWFGTKYQDEAIRMNLDMTGAMIRFSISNELRPDWNLSNLDTERSYVVIEQIDDKYNVLGECVRYTGLAATTVQTITVPAAKDDGTPFESGAYRFRVGVYQKGSDYVQEFIPDGFIMVLDASNDNIAGLWGYTIDVHDDLSSDIRVMAENNEPIQSFGISAGRLTQTERDREFATYTAGLDLFQFYVGSVSQPQSYFGFEIGAVAGVRFWNAAANPSEEDLAAYEFIEPEYDITVGEGTAQVYIGTYGASDIVKSVPQGAAGLGMTNIYLTAGMNTFCCQTVSSAGVVSPINYFYVYVTNTQPTVELSVDSYVPSIKPSEIEGQTNVDSITYRIDEAFSELGDIILEVVQRNPINNYTPVYVNGVEYTETNDYNDIVVPVKAGDLVTIKMDSYSNTLDNATVLFIARDDYGAITVVTPELGEVYRDGYYTNDPESVRFGLYEQDPWKYSDIWTGITYNEPVEIYNAGEDKLNGEDIDGKFVSYIYGATVLEIVNVTSEDLYVNKYNIESNDISLGELDRWWDHYSEDSVWSTQDTYAYGVNLDLLDWENAVIEISGDDIDGTVTLPYGASTPNAAGLIWFKYSEYSGLELAFADPISETEYDSDHRLYRSYTIKVKDIAGNDHVFTEEYTNQYVYYTDGGASLVYGFDDPIYGVDLNLKVYLENGGNVIHTNMCKDGVFNGSFTDAYGNVWPISYEIIGTSYNAEINFSTLEPTMNPVTVTIKSDVDITVTEYDETIVTIENNGTTEVTVTAKENTRFYIDTIGRYVDVENIFTPSYSLNWNISDELVENGGEFAGPVTVTLLPDEIYEYNEIFDGLEYELIDRYTGDAPSFTFYYGDATSYTFKAEDLAYICGNETAVLTEDITVTLPVTIIETAPFVPGLGEEDYIPVDEESPEVQLLAYTQQNGLYIDTQLMLRVTNGEYSYLQDHYGYTVYETASPRAATASFVNALGWGSAYRFHLEAFDISKYSFIIKEGLFAETPEYGAVSDTIEGVSLVGRQLTVTAPCAFTLFVVDENGLATAIPLDLSNIGTSPIPGTVKVPVDGGVRIYLTEPVCGEGQSVNDLTIVPSGYEVSVDTDAESEYYGLSYITVDQNGIYNINYSYMYTFDAGKEPAKIDGTVSERVIEIRSEKIYLVGSIKWSDNFTKPLTNNNVTATMQFSQHVKEIQVPAELVDDIKVRINGTIVTVRYDCNCKAITLTVIAAGGTSTTVDLAAVSNIDKDAPTLSVKDRILSSDGRTVSVTLHSDEAAIFAKDGSYGTEVEEGCDYTVTVKENGTFTYTFADMAGNISTISVTVEGIIDTALKLEYSKDGVDFVTDALSLSLSIGDKIYVRANRDSNISMNGSEEMFASAGESVELTVNAGMSGLWPIIRAEDVYGNVVLGQLGQVKLPDMKAPIVDLINNLIVVEVGTSISELEALLRSNVTASDIDTNLSYSFEYELDLAYAGSCQVTYTVSDSSGNATSVYGIIRVAAEGEPIVKINGDIVVRDTIYVADDDSILLSVDTQGEPYSVVYKDGLKSVGQMKIGITDLVRNATSTDEILLPFEESGYYTVCIITQSRDYYRIQIYVE